jgi:hypothetical protein
VPRLAAHGGARIAKRLVLETTRRNADGVSVLKQPIAIGTYKVDHGLTQPDVPVQPEPAVHGVNHPGLPHPELPGAKGKSDSTKPLGPAVWIRVSGYGEFKLVCVRQMSLLWLITV